MTEGSGDGYQNAAPQFTGRDEAICVGQALYEKTRPECLLWAEVISIAINEQICENAESYPIPSVARGVPFFPQL